MEDEYKINGGMQRGEAQKRERRRFGVLRCGECQRREKTWGLK